MLGLNDGDIIARDESDIKNNIHYLHKPYFVPRLHTKRGASAANEFKYDKTLGEDNVINRFVNKIGEVLT